MLIKKLLVKKVLILRQGFLIEVVQNQKKKIYTSCLREGLEIHLAFTALIASGTMNYYCLVKECLEFHFPSNHCQSLETQPCSN